MKITKKVWIWFKKGLVLNTISTVLTYMVLLLLGVDLTKWVTNPISFVAVIVTGHVIFEGFLIEKIDKWKWTN